MNYKKIYECLIEKSKNRILKDYYYEVHHIVPRCLGGSDDPNNLARLTPEEHYLAHQLLVKIYPENQKLIYAAVLMCSDRAGKRSNNKIYGWIRRKLSESRKGKPKSEAHREKLREVNLGKKLSEETKTKMSNSRLGNTHGRGNKSKKKPPRTKDHIEKLSSALKKPKSEKGRENIANAHKERSKKIIIKKKKLYIEIFDLIDEGIKNKEIIKRFSLRDREFYSIKKNRIEILSIIGGK